MADSLSWQDIQEIIRQDPTLARGLPKNLSDASTWIHRQLEARGEEAIPASPAYREEQRIGRGARRAGHDIAEEAKRDIRGAEILGHIMVPGLGEAARMGRGARRLGHDIASFFTGGGGGARIQKKAAPGKGRPGVPTTPPTSPDVAMQAVLAGFTKPFISGLTGNLNAQYQQSLGALPQTSNPFLAQLYSNIRQQAPGIEAGNTAMGNALALQTSNAIPAQMAQELASAARYQEVYGRGGATLNPQDIANPALRKIAANLNVGAGALASLQAGAASGQSLPTGTAPSRSAVYSSAQQQALQNALLSSGNLQTNLNQIVAQNRP